MKTFGKVILVLTILLSLATGIFKVLQQKADIDLFEKIGIGVLGTTVLGLIQIIGGTCLIFPRFRKSGALIMMLTFALATVAVFANKMYVFGLVSLLFIAMAAFVFVTAAKQERN